MSGLPKNRQMSLDAFYHGATVKDVTKIRSTLTDDFTFTSPIGNHDNPDSFARSLLDFDGTVSDSKMISDGDHLVLLFTLDMGVKIPMCDVIEFRGDKLCSMTTYTDSKLFEPDTSH